MPIKRKKSLPIINAKRAIKLVISPKDIARADKQEPSSCVVARACKKLTHATEVRVHLSRVYIRSNEGNWQRYMTPRSLRNEIIAFDRGGSFEPGTFVLGPPPRSRAATGKRQGTDSKVKRGRKRRKYHVITNVRTGPAHSLDF